MKKAALIFACMLTVVAAAATQQGSSRPASETTQAIVKSYLTIQAALAADRFEDVKAPAKALVTQATDLGKDGATLAQAAKAFDASADLKAAREAFGPLSDAVIARVKADGSKEALAGLRIGYCPMVKRSWLQREEQLKNPYYGTSMLTCGDLKPLTQ